MAKGRTGRMARSFKRPESNRERGVAGPWRRALARPPLFTLPTRLINEESGWRTDELGGNGEKSKTGTRDGNAEEGLSREREGKGLRERGQEINYHAPTQWADF